MARVIKHHIPLGKYKYIMKHISLLLKKKIKMKVIVFVIILFYLCHHRLSRVKEINGSHVDWLKTVDWLTWFSYLFVLLPIVPKRKFSNRYFYFNFVLDNDRSSRYIEHHRSSPVHWLFLLKLRSIFSVQWFVLHRLVIISFEWRLFYQQDLNEDQVIRAYVWLLPNVDHDIRSQNQ